MANYRCQTQRRNTQIKAEIIQTYDLLKFALARSNGSSFLLIKQYEMPFINKSEMTKRSKDLKYTANVQMARTVGVVFGLSVLFTRLQQFSPPFDLSSRTMSSELVKTTECCEISSSKRPPSPRLHDKIP